MSFKTYIKNIEEKTGKTAQDFQNLAEQKGFTINGELAVKATEITNWLKREFELGHGHAMAMYAYIQGKRK
ncbi:DUF4287 domain-containing protein [uncultured Marixanthomonas sp.]|uniref:DUF4287 domain-containing protein n=1 Tax=uncultured Marixanthomonas sp. TaxID=757245 RepID=UPI0030DA924E|tara:strand:+ start:4229 stop:4441 length:213 start_codon:yes stop_codon:yes gene_type:complete